MTLESGQVLAARYALLRKLGDGGTGEAWLASDRGAGVNRVLKVLRPELAAQPAERERFLRAARVQRDCAHPGILRFVELHEGDPLFAVFAHEAEGDLSRLRARGWQQVLTPLRQLAEALGALHAGGWVHRDLKPANVLLGGDGRPLLSDFDLSAAIGDESAARGGSPFSASPQQLQGAPPAVADDVYAFGALAYELLTGYPPFYPDAAAARLAVGPPQAVGARVPVPEELDRIVQRCLARDAAERPRAMEDVVAILQSLERHGTDEVSVPRVASAPVALRAPEPPTPTIEPQWRRGAPAGPSAAELRSQGFRRGVLAAALAFLLVAAGLVFFALPAWVERNAARGDGAVATSAAPSAPATQKTAERDLERLAAAKRAYEELRPAVARRLAALDGRAAGTWGGEEFARGKQRFPDAEADFGRRLYDSALTKLREADAALQGTERRAPGALQAALAAGAAAVEAGDAGAARRQFELALRIDAQNPAAKRGLARADSLEEVRRLLAEAAAHEREGATAAAAAAYRKALQLDPDTVAARSALVRLQSEVTGSEFAAAVAEGLAALSRKDYRSARAAYERAGRLRPGAPEVQDGLARIDRALGDRSIATQLEAAQRAEREERWRDALAGYREALRIDANLLAAQQGVERSEPRAMLDAELSAYLERPERLFSSDVRGAARSVLQRAGAVPSPGPVLTRQVAEVRNLLAAAETPVRVAIASDSQTEVMIYRIGRLGTFERKDMELMPGKYTVVGTRAGYRDVRRELTILPGQPAPSLVIRCEEQI
jgi:tetratricopeptide (TPR) repeat protein